MTTKIEWTDATCSVCGADYERGRYCVPCKRRRSRESYAKNRDTILKRRKLKPRDRDKENARKRAWLERNPTKPAEYNRTWREKHPDRVNAWQRANPDKMKEHYRRWRLSHPEVASTVTARRRARKKGAIGEFTAVEWSAIVKRQGGHCADCHSKERLTKDHIVPLSRGGCNYAFNIQGLCYSCNSRKKDRLGDAPPSLFDRAVA